MRWAVAAKRPPSESLRPLSQFAPAVRPGDHQIGESADDDRREHERGRPHLVEGRAWRGERLAWPRDVDGLEREPPHGEGIEHEPGPSQLDVPRGPPAATYASHERGQRYEQERHIDPR